jgi:integrase
MQNESQTTETAGQKEPSSNWQTVGENLIRYVPSGVYHARIRAGGKLVRQSLKTDVFTIAKQRLSDLEQSLRQMVERQTEVSKGRMTFGDALKIYSQRKQSDATLKPNTKLYWANRAKAMVKSWAGIESMDVRKIAKHDCLIWAGEFAKGPEGDGVSDSAYNNTVDMVKGVFEIAIEFGARLDNPAKELSRRTVNQKRLTLPTSEQFKAFVVSVGNGGGNRNRYSQPCAFFVQFLAYGGFRKEEATYIRWQDIDLDKGIIQVWGHDETGTKNGEMRVVPIISNMRTLLAEIKAFNAKLNRTVEPTDKVMEVSECEKSMTRACIEVGMARITHHDLKHLFATRCIENGVDIPTVSKWLGHKDGGVLAMKTYNHLRQEHSLRMAQSVSF